ncbi:MAG: SUMF1/EgtB/PvdO family nonheme iron enzyme [Saprospiraceae bacterium]
MDNNQTLMKKSFLTIFALFSTIWIYANNVQITNVSFKPNTNTIKFDISWENSWRSSVLNNWDAAYVFIKYFDPGTGTWLHVPFTNTNNVIPNGFSVSEVPGVGRYLYRSVSGSGTAQLTNVELGIESRFASGIYDIKLFALEMVHIPVIDFYLGDHASYFSFQSSFENQAPVLIKKNETINVYDPYPSEYVQVSNTSPFYIMKYELSQGGYRDFLNSLTYTQQVNHTASPPTSPPGTFALAPATGNYRNYIKIKTPAQLINGVYTPAVYGCNADFNSTYDELSDGENIACNFVNWVDHAAYLAWAGLRPLTEIEYEIAGKGIQYPVKNEYAWGNAEIGDDQYFVFDAAFNTEYVNNPQANPKGNAIYEATVNSNNNLNGPVRNGIFATASSNRIKSGGSFYGVMELSGNLRERVITTENGQGRNFNKNNFANPDLTSYGYVDWANSWPGAVFVNSPYSIINGTGLALGLMYRGGSWNDESFFLSISDRSGPLINDTNTNRDPYTGIRGCR